eukprot:XP_028344784.1 uncharacterized protein LOC112062828 [Physeter catodon]
MRFADSSQQLLLSETHLQFVEGRFSLFSVVQGRWTVCYYHYYYHYYYDVYIKSPLVEWCRAAPERGRPEFGVCLPHGTGSARYMVEVVPVVGPGVNLQSDVKLSITGTTGRQTKPITIATEASGTERRVTVDRADIGDPETVLVFLTGKGPWQCHRITIWKDFRYWLYDCSGTLDALHRDATYHMSGSKIYQAIIMTGNDEHAGTSGTIELTLIGTERQTTAKTLVHDVRPGTERKIRFRAADVGDVTALVLQNTAETDPWYCDFARIKTDDGRVFSFNVKRWIGTPFEKAIRVTLKPSKDTDTAAQDVDCHTRGSDFFSRVPKSLRLFKVRCPMNCQMSDFARVEGLSIHPSFSSICAAAVIDGVLSPSGGEVVVSVVGEIPHYKGAAVKEAGLHMPECTIFAELTFSDLPLLHCAFVEGRFSLFSVVQGRWTVCYYHYYYHYYYDVYIKSPLVGDVTALVLQNTAETDPWYCDFARIKTDDGRVFSFNVKRWIGTPFEKAIRVTLKPSKDTDTAAQDVDCHTRGSDFFSRLMWRLLSICSKQGEFTVFTLDSARKACHDLGYLHGMYLEDGCTNVCAGKGYPVSVAGVMCLGPERSLKDCTFEEPPSQCADHSLDVAIQCTNNPVAEPPLGSLRIVDESNSPSTTGIGRLQFYNNGWGSVCSDGWTPESELVACMQMGYSGLKHGGYSDEACASVNGVNYCGPEEEKIAVFNVGCTVLVSVATNLVKAQASKEEVETHEKQQQERHYAGRSALRERGRFYPSRQQQQHRCPAVEKRRPAVFVEAKRWTLRRPVDDGNKEQEEEECDTSTLSCVDKMSRSIVQVFEEYQKARVHFVQTIADLSSRAQNIETLYGAGVMSLLRPLLLDNVPSIQQTAALALGRLASHSEELAQEVVTQEILPQLAHSVAQQNRFYKRSAAFVIRAISKHSPELAQVCQEIHISVTS